MVEGVRWREKGKGYISTWGHTACTAAFQQMIMMAWAVAPRPFAPQPDLSCPPRAARSALFCRLQMKEGISSGRLQASASARLGHRRICSLVAVVVAALGTGTNRISHFGLPPALATTFPPRFDSLTISSTATSVQRVFAGDIDGDGLVDVASVADTTNMVAWHKNGGAFNGPSS